jgi:hypothetical protein
MGGFYADKAREEFAIPDSYESVAVLALGYLGDPEPRPEDLRMRETAVRTRKTLEAFVFSGPHLAAGRLRQESRCSFQRSHRAGRSLDTTEERRDP